MICMQPIAPFGEIARGRPRLPRDLLGHEGIRMSNIAGSETLILEGSKGERHEVPFGGRFRIDHGLAAREALLAGRGIAPAHHWLIGDLLADGRLEARAHAASPFAGWPAAASTPLK